MTPSAGERRSKRKLCGAKTRAGRKCKGLAMRNGRCRMHGGATPGGLASPHFIHGRYSKFFPGGVAERYETSRADPEMLSVAEEVAVIQTRICDLARRVATGESGELWRRTREEFELMKLAKDPEEATARLTQVDRLLYNGAADERIWGELIEMIEKKTLVAAREWKRQVDLRQVITADRAIMLITTIVEIVRKHVPNRRTLDKIQRDVGEALGGHGHQPIRSTLHLARNEGA